MKTMYGLSLMVVVAAVLVTFSPVRALATETDDRIESSAKDSYVFKKYLKEDDIKVKSENGAVTLSGSVTEESHKSLAHETVASLPGVKSVDNRLEVKGESVAERSDAWITMKVKTMLLFHRNVSARTEVDTKNGIVTLRGEADNQAQLDLTSEHVKDVEGVKGVENKMVVAGKPGKPTEKSMGDKVEDVGEAIDDASITGLVKMTLLYHRSTSGLRTKVETKKGQVTLSGKAGSADEKDLAAKYAQDVTGVKSVVNDITIEKPKAN
jgi:osmotically-inducible protein OsmY